jgi:hypothetical protein
MLRNGTPFLIAAIVSAFALHSALAASSEIQMLPPLDFSGNVCAGTNGGVLYWDGTTSIKCIPGTVGTSSGWVGIGTASPQYPLDIRNDNTFNQIHLSGDGADDGAYLLGGSAGAFMSSGLAFEGTNWVAKSSAGSMIVLEQGGAGNGNIYFNVYPGLTPGSNVTTGSTAMTITTSGNVGIGITSPNESLEVNGAVRVASVATTLVSPNSGAMDYNPAQASMRFFSQGPNSSTMGGYYFVEYSSDASQARDVLRIDSSGNVGIGIVSPRGPLDVYSTESNLPYGVITGWAQGASGTNGVYGTSSDAIGVLGATGNNMMAAVEGAYASPGQGGYTAGALSWQGYGVACLSGSCGGDAAWTNWSDRRLKERIADLPDDRGLNTIAKLRPVTFHWKDKNRDAKEGQRIGFIAQEIEPYYPEAVSTDLHGTKSLSYADITVPLVKAVQELKADNDDLRQMVEAQSRAMKELKADNDKLRALVSAIEDKSGVKTAASH